MWIVQYVYAHIALSFPMFEPVGVSSTKVSVPNTNGCTPFRLGTHREIETLQMLDKKSGIVFSVCQSGRGAFTLRLTAVLRISNDFEIANASPTS